MPEAWQSSTWEDGIPRIATGVPSRVDRLKCLGNAVVPQQFYPVFRAIAQIEGEEKNRPVSGAAGQDWFSRFAWWDLVCS